MAKYYGSGLIGLDMKPKRVVRDYRSYKGQRRKRWLLAILIALSGLVLSLWLGGR